MLPNEIGLLKKAIARIYHANGSVIGAGFLISESCLLTCAHVVTEALGIPQTTSELPTALVELDFPFVSSSTPLKAQVIFWSPVKPGRRGEDIAGLKLEGKLPEGMQPLSLLRTTQWWKHSFGTFGFPQGHNSGIWASGELKEQRGDDGWVQIEAIRAEGYPVLPGFSGSPVWDENAGGIVGMTVAAEKKRTEARTAFMIPTEILANAIEELSLIEILSSATVPIERSIREAFKACCPRGWSRPMPEAPAAIVAELQEMPQGDAQHRRILQFAARLAATEPAISQQLEGWAVSQGYDWQALMGQIQPAPTVSQMSYLFIKVEDTKPKSDEYIVSALFAPEHTADDRWNWRCRQLTVPQPPSEQTGFKLDEISALLDGFLEQVDPFRFLTIEFFLPLDLLSHAVDTWEEEGLGIPEVIGHKYKVIVRSVERLTPLYNRYKGTWQQKWAVLKQVQQQQSAAAFIPGDGCDPKALLTQLKAETAIGLQLVQLPEQTKLKGIFTALLQSGVPVGLWARQDLTQGNSQAEFDRILKCCVVELRDRITQERSNACNCAPNPHIGQHLSLLWEDPDRLPEVFQYEMP